MKYSDAVAYLFSFLNFERVPFKYQRELNLFRMKKLLSWFGQEVRFPSVLVAGTKGKGSTANFLASLLKQLGLRVGLYTSPHLSELRERMKLNGVSIGRSEFARLLSRMRRTVELRKNELKGAGEITFFEILTLAAILYFSRHADISIFEIGMGGRLDASNVLQPLLSVITPIHYDHEEHLGRTIKKIAGEKAAIIKQSGILVSGRQLKEVSDVLKARCREVGATSFFLGRDFDIRNSNSSLEGNKFDFVFDERLWRNLRTRQLGKFQIDNAATALAALSLLSGPLRLELNFKEIRAGLEQAMWPGRFEYLHRGKNKFILDGAHNGAAMHALVTSIKEIVSTSKIPVVFGTSREKNLDRLLHPMKDISEVVVVTKSSNVRAQDPRVIIKKMFELGFSCPLLWSDDLSHALKLVEVFHSRRPVLITGSLFLVGDARRLLKCR